LTERVCSDFIDKLLDGAIHTTPDNTSYFEIWVDGHHIPLRCVGHIYGFSYTKLSHRFAHIISKHNNLLFDEWYKLAQRVIPHGLHNHPSNSRKHYRIDVKNSIQVWLNDILEGLVNTAPDDPFEYMPCYIRPADLLEDCKEYLKVHIFFNVVMFISLTLLFRILELLLLICLV
jgi:hypothetical protein